jgi:hypothetical protein
MKAFAQAGDRIALYRFHQGMLGGFLFYSGRTWPNLGDADALRRHLESDTGEGGRALVLMRAATFAEAAQALPFPILEARRYTYRKMPGAGRGGASGDYILAARAPSPASVPDPAPAPQDPALAAPPRERS